MKQRQSNFEIGEDLIQKEKLVKKTQAYRSILKSNPNDPAAHHNFAILLRKLNRIEEAIEQSRNAYELSPNNPKIVLSLGLSLEFGGFFEEAENRYNECLLLEPDYAPALNNLGRLMEHKGHSFEASSILRKANQLHPLDNNISLNLANVYLSLGQPGKAENLISNPQSAEAYNSLGIAKYVQRDWVHAEKLFRKAVEIEPNFAGAHENLALTLFHLGKFGMGWVEYEWRWRNTANLLTKRSFRKPIWEGEALKGKTLLLHSEQGFGDTIQFIRFAGLIEKDKGRILLMCQPKLADLLECAPGIDEVLLFDRETPYYDFHAPLLNTAKFAWLFKNEFPTVQSYIEVPKVPMDTDTSYSFAKKFKIGICWSGRSQHPDDPYRNRSCSVKLFKKIAQLPGVELYNLQVDQRHRKSRTGFNLIEPFKRISTFTDTAEVIATLDLVVSIDTAVIHLTGAMGKPGIVILNYAADWRWGNGGGKAPWYPSIYMVRQDSPGEWKPVFNKVSTLIKNSYLS